MTPRNIDQDRAGMLLPSEQVIFIASQSRFVPGGTLIGANSVYITNMRVLYKDPKWYGLKADVLDISYKDISTIMFKRGIFSTEIYFKPHFSNYKVKLPALDKKAAQRISQLVQRGIRGELPSQNSNNNYMSTAPEIQKVQVVMEATDSGSIEAIDLQAAGGQSKPADTTADASCRYCNCTIMLPASKFCHECGKNLEVKTNIWKVCPNCNSFMTDDSVFCAECHQKFPENFLQ
jgi:PH (Pleckstrin Homology) domain-containing protein